MLQCLLASNADCNLCVYEWQVQRQADEIVGLLGAAQGFRQVTSGQKGIAAHRVVAQVLHSLSRLGDALSGILPSQIYVQASGQVLQAVLQTVIGRVTQNVGPRKLMPSPFMLNATGSG